MNKSEYENQLLLELEKNKDNIAEKLGLLIQNLTKDIIGIDITIFTSQEGDGCFKIYALALGRDLYIRQKEIHDFARLFDPEICRSVSEEPYIPHILMVSAAFFDPFEVNNTIVDTVAKWMQINFSNINYPPNVTFRIHGDDYGTITPIVLSK